MRRLSFVAALLLAGPSSADIHEAPPTEVPARTVSKPGQLFVALGETSSVRFILAAGRVESVEILVAGKRSVSDVRDCAIPSSIHADTLQLLREDLLKDAHRREAYELLFEVGSEQDESFDRSPRITLYWVNGKLVNAEILRAIDVTIARTENLCTPGKR